MNLILRIFFVLTLAFLSSCQTSEPIAPTSSDGLLSLSFSSSQLMKSFNKVTSGSASKVIVDIEDGSGQTIYTNKEITLISFNGEYVSEPISINAGTYNLTKFLVADESNNVIYAAPVAGSATAYLVNNPLTLELTVTKDETEKVIVEVLDATGLAAEDFGYATFGFEVVETTGFKIAAFIFNETTENFELTTAEITINDGIEEIYSGSLQSSTNNINLPDSISNLNISISKLGYLNYDKSFNNTDINQYIIKPLEIILTKDPFVLIINADGLQGGNIFVDSSYYEKTVNVFGNLYTDQSIKKKGSASAYFDGSEDYLLINSDEDFNFSDKNFTLDCWVNFASLGPGKPLSIFSQRSSSADIDKNITLFYRTDLDLNQWQIQIGKSNQLYTKNYFSEEMFPNLNEWYHIAVVRNGTSLRLYINGIIQIDAELENGYILHNSTQPFLIGAYQYESTITSNYFHGHIDDFRISNGFARWTSEFTP